MSRAADTAKNSKNSKYLDLVKELAVTDFKIKYQGSVLGYAWSLFKPLAMFGVLYLVFTVFVKIGSNIPHYALYLLLGIVIWNFFTDLTDSALNSIVDKSDLMRKVYFPPITIVLSTTISSFITFILNLLVVFVFMTIAGIHFSLDWFLFPLLLIEFFIFSLGLSLVLATLYVKYRDIGHIWEVTLQLLFYASAIIYPLNIVPLRFQKLIILNPLTQMIQDARYILITKETIIALDILNLPYILIPYLLPIFLLIFGIYYFNSASKQFAEIA